MQIVRGRATRLEWFPVDGNLTDINEGALLMPGITEDSNVSALIVASGGCAKAVGLIARKHTAGATLDCDPDAGTVAQTIQANGDSGGCARQVALLLPGAEVAAEMDQATASLVSVASATSTVLTITNMEDAIDGSWVYVVSGTGAGQIAYVKATASGSFTVKSAMATTLDNTSKIIVMRRKFHGTAEVNSTADKIKSTAAAGTWKAMVLRNEFRYPGAEGWIELDPTVHHNLVLDTTQIGIKFRQILAPKDTLHNPLS